MTIRLAIVDDVEVVVRGLAEMLRPFAGEVQLLPLDSRKQVDADVDIALFDPFPPANPEGVALGELVAHPRLGKVVVYTWHAERALVEGALRTGAVASLSKTCTAPELLAAIKRVHAGEPVGLGPSDGGDSRDGADGTDGTDGVAPRDSADGTWPGHGVGLTARESEVIGLITQGLSNQEIAERASLSINSVKSYIRTSYRKMGVTSRTNAVLWGLDHGFDPGRGRGPGLN
jgi:DNA-binding NarL/FixJ family response regulator